MLNQPISTGELKVYSYLALALKEYLALPEQDEKLQFTLFLYTLQSIVLSRSSFRALLVECENKDELVISNGHESSTN